MILNSLATVGSVYISQRALIIGEMIYVYSDMSSLECSWSLSLSKIATN
jgi:hypothetical protein